MTQQKGSSRPDKPRGSQDKTAREYEVKLSPPWGGSQTVAARVATHVRQCKTSGSDDDGQGEIFVVERSRVHEAYIREQEKTKRLGLILAAALLIAAGAMLLFAPAGREKISYFVAVALLLFAAGAAGYKRVWATTKSYSFGADQGSHVPTKAEPLHAKQDAPPSDV
jgi:hypothetical protein